MDSNPYQPPQAPLFPESKQRMLDPESPRRGEVYPYWNRFWAASIDNALATILALVIGMNVPQHELPPVPHAPKGGLGAMDIGRLIEQNWAQVIAVVGFYLLYYFVFELALGRTPGKWLMSLKVVGIDGARCRWRQILMRTLVRIIDTNPLILGGLPACISVLLSPSNQRIGDFAAHTQVVRAD